MVGPAAQLGVMFECALLLAPPGYHYTCVANFTMCACTKSGLQQYVHLLYNCFAVISVVS